MLVLARKAGESIVLPDLKIEIRVRRISGNRVQVGIQAPPEIVICRKEISSASQSKDAQPCRIPSVA